MYYILDYSSETKIIGPQYPQIQELKLGYDYDANNSVYKLPKYYEALPNFVPDLDGFTLHPTAKTTDFLSNALIFNGFIISEKVKSLITQFKLPTHEFYPIKLYQGTNHINNYYWMHMISDLTGVVDYSNSIFFIKKFIHDLGNIQIFSKNDLIEKRASLKEKNKGHNVTISAKKIAFTETVNYDLFEIGNFDSNYYISQRLKDALEHEQVNGITVQTATIFL